MMSLFAKRWRCIEYGGSSSPRRPFRSGFSEWTSWHLYGFPLWLAGCQTFPQRPSKQAPSCLDFINHARGDAGARAVDKCIDMFVCFDPSPPPYCPHSTAALSPRNAATTKVKPLHVTATINLDFSPLYSRRYRIYSPRTRGLFSMSGLFLLFFAYGWGWLIDECILWTKFNLKFMLLRLIIEGGCE